jgi:RNA polymerase sigma factor (sigma-70 family)
MVYGVCRLVLRDADEAEDAAQQTFLSAYRGLLAGQVPREPSAWLGTIARNECRSRLRGRTAEPVTVVTMLAGDDTQREVGRRAEVEALCAAVVQLPPQQRDAIVLREFYGLSYAEVAAALGLSGAAVESLLFRSRRRLQEQLRPLRAALGVLAFPATLRESLARALPGFGGAGGAAGAGALAKFGSAPLAGKLAAASLVLGTAGTVAGLERESRHSARSPRPEGAKQAPDARAAVAAPLRVSAPRSTVESARSERRDGPERASSRGSETRNAGERGAPRDGSREARQETSSSGEGAGPGHDERISGTGGEGNTAGGEGSGAGEGSSPGGESGSGGDSGN